MNEALFEEEELGAMMKNDLSFFLFFLCVKRLLRVDQCFVSASVFFFCCFLKRKQAKVFFAIFCFFFAL